MKNVTQSTGTFSTSTQPSFTQSSFTQLLPSTARAFFIYLVGLLAFCGGLSLYILLSVQILEAEDVLYKKEAAYHEINQQNADIVWRISQASTLARVQQQAETLGYTVADSHHYVQIAALPAIAQQVAAVQATSLQATTLQPSTLQPTILEPVTLTRTTLAMRIQTLIEAASRYLTSWQRDTDYQTNQS